jgi:hypothetical protein
MFGGLIDQPRQLRLRFVDGGDCHRRDRYTTTPKSISACRTEARKTCGRKRIYITMIRIMLRRLESA